MSENHHLVSRAAQQTLRFVFRLSVFVGVFILLLLPVYGQDVTPKRGFQAGGSYAPGDIETINTVNGNLVVTVPLASLPAGRGSAPGFALNLVYNSKLYDSHEEIVPDSENRDHIENHINPSEKGGWRYALGYDVELINRTAGGEYPCECGSELKKNDYKWKLRVTFPDGSEHELRPVGFNDYFGDAYFDTDPTGVQYGTNCHDLQGHDSCTVGQSQLVTTGMNYFSTDGSFLRLFVPYSADGQWKNTWTLYLPNGGRVTNVYGPQRVYDRNNNFIEFGENNITDQLGRSITFTSDTVQGQPRDHIHLSGFGSEPLVWTVKWKHVYVSKTYQTRPINLYPQTLSNDQLVVDEITLPEQLGSYTFGYSADNTDPYPNSSNGWGELNYIRLPTGAAYNYGYAMDGINLTNLQLSHPNWVDVMHNRVIRKDRTYLLENDVPAGTPPEPTTETWNYTPIYFPGLGFSHTTTITSPDGGVEQDFFEPTEGSFGLPSNSPLAGLVYKSVHSDGSVVERIWRENIPHSVIADNTTAGINPYVKTEFVSIKDAGGDLVKTAIKDYDYDKNGNLTREADYDWVLYADAHSGNGLSIPQGLSPKRIILTSYNDATPNATDSSTDSANSYWNPTAPNLHGAPLATEIQEVQDQAVLTLSRAEFSYDDFGNVTRQTHWDSTKGAYSNPLTISNSICVSTQYNQYGAPTLTTDARGYQTQITYGAIGGFSDLYPTQVRTAHGTSVQRTTTSEYDFSTGLVTRVTDADNNVSTATIYDALGRPTLVIAAEGKPEATSTLMIYHDASRRVITRTDLTTLGDAKLVSINHYDQLGRVRLSRQLEDSSTQSVTDEAVGIKVQTRYSFSGANSYQVSSHPYREAYSWQATGAMDWTRSKADNASRSLEIEKFGGTSLPFPWGSNTGGSGQVVTTHDANFTTVTDQAGKARRSMTNGLGQLVRVDEPDSTNGNLDDQNNLPVQSTSYTYDALGNLRTVTQGSQQRFFAYDSMSRLLRARNPEQIVNPSLPSFTDPVSGNNQWSMAYTYDDNGNLATRIDARNITSTYVYDALDRNTSVTYTNDPANTPAVTRSYDGASNGKGKLWKSQNAGDFGSLRTIDSYDAFGRPLTQSQQFHANDQWSIPFTTSATYDKAGQVVTQSYPSGHAVNYTFDTAGRVSSFTGNLGDGESTRTYANEFQYTESGAIQQERFGTDTPLYHKQRFNERGQLWDVRLSTVPFATDPANADRGAIVNYYSNNFVQGSTGADNNGNLLRQETYIPGSGYFQDNFSYDKLNRLTSISEKLNGTGNDTFKQAYTFDRWGNRLIDQTNTWGGGINKKDFTVNTANNRLGIPSNQTGAMSYDATGNLSNDTYTGAGSRVYDPENRMIAATNNGGQTSSYTYDGDGRRVGRRVGNPETWQVYGIGGELVAEYDIQYRSIGPYTLQEVNLSKEYGYRNGELLVISGFDLACDPSELCSELETGGEAEGGPDFEGGPEFGHVATTRWIVTDQLGTPRMIVDQTGSLSGMKRHDYLPFGEELTGVGLRSTTQGYGTPDGTRQQFTLKERDTETGLDFFERRYYGSLQGRFTSPDSYNIISEKEKGRNEKERMQFFVDYISQPQIWNKYTYVLNNPLKHSDPDGRRPVTAEDEARLKKLHDWAYARASELANDNQGAAQSLRDAADASGREIRQAILEAPGGEGEGGPQETPGNPAGLGAVFYVIDHLGDMNFATGPNAGSVSYTNNGWSVFVGQKDYKCNFFLGMAFAQGGGIGLGGTGVPVYGTKGGLGGMWGNGNFPMANDWAAGSVANFARVSSPRVGDVAAWGGIGHGHLAVVMGGGFVGYGNQTAGVKVQATSYVSADRHSAPAYFRYKP